MYKQVTVSAIDLARLLDWADMSTVQRPGSITGTINDYPEYLDAYRGCSECLDVQTHGNLRRD